MSNNSSVKRPNLPGIKGLNLPDDAKRILEPIKELLDIHEGRRGDPTRDRFVRMEELGDAVSRETTTYGTRPSDGKAPDPPVDINVIAGSFGNKITWVNATNNDLWAVEVFCATENDWTKSAKVATVTIPPDSRGGRSEFFHQVDDLTSDHYYWLRSVDYAGNASRLVPPQDDGAKAPGADTISETIDKILKTLIVPNAPAWDPAKEDYEAGDIVEHNEKLWQCYNAPVPAGTEPGTSEGRDYWRRTGILVQGDVDGQPTVGINGNLVVKDTILSRSIKTSELVVGSNIDISNGAIRIEHMGFDIEE